MSEMTTEEYGLLGYAYGILCNQLPNDDSNPLTRPLNLQNACERPQIGLTLAINKVHALHKVSKELDKKLMKILSQIDHYDEKCAVIPLADQGVWWQGYYKARTV